MEQGWDGWEYGVTQAALRSLNIPLPTRAFPQQGAKSVHVAECPALKPDGSGSSKSDLDDAEPCERDRCKLRDEKKKKKEKKLLQEVPKLPNCPAREPRPHYQTERSEAYGRLKGKHRGLPGRVGDRRLLREDGQGGQPAGTRLGPQVLQVAARQGSRKQVLRALKACEAACREAPLRGQLGFASLPKGFPGRSPTARVRGARREARASPGAFPRGELAGAA
ncbi:Receptor-Type Tyrosine-Protein Phosphatase Gamma [Manis pentadactyla]|nr:Receptor-Type Tyrosine-Protein Phosphatase Gamma [Manis pentadactyla]